MDEKIGSYHDTCHTIFISHGDCEEDANYVAEKVKEKIPDQHDYHESGRSHHRRSLRSGNNGFVLCGR